MSTPKKKKRTRTDSTSGAGTTAVHKTTATDSGLDALLADVKAGPNEIEPVIRLSEHYLSHGREESILEVVAPLEQNQEAIDDKYRRIYDRLLAFGYAYRGRLVDAEKICRRGLTDESNALDFNFILCYTHLALREFDLSIADGQRYLTLREKSRHAQEAAPEYTTSDRHLSQIYNFLGSAFLEKGELESASKYFDQSRQADPGNYLPFVNLARIYRENGQHDEAREIAKQGISCCRQVQELNMLAAEMKKKSSVSACMIVKDEEELLPGCLDSIRNWVDEIIIVDTGSTDRTEDIARSYGARLFHQPWEGNFSRHRNYSIEQATGDWVFIIDADERFAEKDVPALLEILNSETHQIVSINVFNLYAESDHKVTSVNSVRFFRRELDMHYREIVHNRLDMPEGVPVTRAPFCLEHLGYDLSREKMLVKLERTKALLEKQIKENPGFAFAWFNLAQLLRGELFESLEKYAPQVLKAAHRAVELTSPDDPQSRATHLMALDQLAWTYFYQEDYEKAEKYARQALDSKPDYLDPLMLLGNLHSKIGEFDRAAAAYHIYLKTQAGFDEHRELEPLVLYHSDSRATAFYGLAIIAELRHNPGQAKQYYENALEATPGYLDARLRLGSLYLAENNFAEAEKCFRIQSEKTHGSVLAFLGLGYVCHQQNRLEEAEMHYRRAEELDGDNPATLLRCAKFFLETRKDAIGLKLLDRVAQIGAGDNETEAQLAQIYFARGDWDRAAEFYQELLQRSPEDPRLLSDLGNCYHKAADYDRADEHYRRAIDTGLADGFVYRNLGLNQLKQGRIPAAAISFEECLKVSQDQPEITHLLADLYFQGKDFPAALTWYEKVLGLQPGNLAALYRLSECYLGMGHQDAAILGFQKVLESDPGHDAARQRIEQLAGPVAGI